MTINKNIMKIAALGFAGILGLSGCNDSFMDKYSETSITEGGFFKTPGDLEIYTNNMYGYIGSNYWDVVSDNVVYVEESSVYSKMRGELNPDKAGTWGWGIFVMLISCWQEWTRSPVMLLKQIIT